MSESFQDMHIFSDPIDMLAYSRDTSVALPGTADQVIRPKSLSALSSAVAAANQHKTPIYVRGGGSMYAGGVNPHAGGTVLDMSGLDKIVEIDLDHGVVVVEPGVRFGALLKALKPHNRTVGIVPLTGPTATVGGAASAHALGTGSVKFQSFADEVVGLEVVLADGSVVRTGSAAHQNISFFARHAFGPDLTGLFLGGDASLGVISLLALWLHPIPAAKATSCIGFPDAAAGAACLAAMQSEEQLHDVWYASIYDKAAVQGRMSAAFPEQSAASWPGFALGLDFGGSQSQLAGSIAHVGQFCETYGGKPFPEFDQVFYRKLRYDETYWYSFAGYFTRSRCGILMTSLPTQNLLAFYAVLEAMRSRFSQFMWAPGAVVCRRGLHGGMLAFYDEQSQWQEMREALAVCANELLAAGCVPYKSGKIWANQLQSLGSHHQLMKRLKKALDPNQTMSPGNLGL